MLEDKETTIEEKTRIKYNTLDYLLLDPPLIMASMLLLTHAMYSMSFGVI
jgi:hypothetical protein